MSKKTIFWEKWIEPLGKNLDEIQWPDWSDTPSVTDIEASASIADEELDGEFMKMELQEVEGFRGLATPQGLISITEIQFGSKLFNFWVGHTNFRLTEADIDAIINVDGVEIWSQFTPYRFRIAVARLFRSDEVKHNVLEAVRNVSDENTLDSYLG